eukprot:scaffold2335_cov175-Amphora_coffeaeformis.AAC.23
MKSRLAVHLRTGAVIVIGSHIGVTLASLGYATGRFGGANAAMFLREDGKGRREETRDARFFQYITEWVTDMYAGRGIRHEHVQLDETVSFSDPAAICEGPSEVTEAFRALRLLKPQSLLTPYCVNVEPKGASIILTYILHQRYMGWISLPSLLIVDVQLRQRPDMPQSDFLVRSVEDQWNGVPLLTTYLNKMARRVNGVVSFQLCQKLLPATD